MTDITQLPFDHPIATFAVAVGSVGLIAKAAGASWLAIGLITGTPLVLGVGALYLLSGSGLGQ